MICRRLRRKQVQPRRRESSLIHCFLLESIKGGDAPHVPALVRSPDSNRDNPMRLCATARFDAPMGFGLQDGQGASEPVLHRAARGSPIPLASCAPGSRTPAETIHAPPHMPRGSVQHPYPSRGHRCCLTCTSSPHPNSRASHQRRPVNRVFYVVRTTSGTGPRAASEFSKRYVLFSAPRFWQCGSQPMGPKADGKISGTR